MHLRLAAVAAPILLPCLPAQALPIAYTQTFTGTGTLGQTSFTDALVTVTGQGDTSDIAYTDRGGFSTDISATLTIAGLGNAAAMTGAMDVFYNDRGSVAGFYDNTAGATLLDLFSADLANYTLNTTSTASGFMITFPGYRFSTTAGDLVFTSRSASGAFSAVVEPAVTPEPSTFILLGTGLLALAHKRRHRSAKP